MKLNDVQLNSDADKQALQSLGIISENDQQEVEISKTTSNLDAKQIEANLIASNSKNGHNKNGITPA